MLVRVEEGEKLHRRARKTHFPRELKINMAAGRSRKASESGSGRKTSEERGEDPPAT
jgi:hypothetical protein